jgi:hypothetical protein
MPKVERYTALGENGTSFTGAASARSRKRHGDGRRAACRYRTSGAHRRSERRLGSVAEVPHRGSKTPGSAAGSPCTHAFQSSQLALQDRRAHRHLIGRDGSEAMVEQDRRWRRCSPKRARQAERPRWSRKWLAPRAVNTVLTPPRRHSN